MHIRHDAQLSASPWGPCPVPRSATGTKQPPNNITEREWPYPVSKHIEEPWQWSHSIRLWWIIDRWAKRTFWLVFLEHFFICHFFLVVDIFHGIVVLGFELRAGALSHASWLFLALVYISNRVSSFGPWSSLRQWFFYLHLLWNRDCRDAPSHLPCLLRWGSC
jgi:hypothetical protein